MITLRPGSHVYRLLLLLAIAGEYPMRSLHLLGSSRTLEDLVHRLDYNGQETPDVRFFTESEGDTYAAV